MKNHTSTVSFLRQALFMLKKEAPSAYESMVMNLGKLRGNFRVGSEVFTLAVVRQDIRVAAGRRSRRAEAEGEITLQGIFQLVDGTATLLTLLSSEALKIKANAEALLKLNAAITLFLEASLKSPAIQNHYEEYRKWVLQGKLRK